MGHTHASHFTTANVIDLFIKAKITLKAPSPLIKVTFNCRNTPVENHPIWQQNILLIITHPTHSIST